MGNIYEIEVNVVGYQSFTSNILFMNSPFNRVHVK